MKVVCVYHFPCMDGFAAATIVGMWCVKEGYEFFPVSMMYGELFALEPGEFDMLVVADFSFPPRKMVELASSVDKLLWMDHHDTAIRAWEGYDAPVPGNIEVVLDNERSGARIAWDRLMAKEGEPTPPVILHIDDRDRWVFKMEGTKEVVEYGFSLPYEFSAYEEWMGSTQKQINRQIDNGKVLYRNKRLRCKEMLAHTRLVPWPGVDAPVPVVNVPFYHASDTLELAMEEFRSNVAISWFDEGSSDQISFSLRGRGSDVHVGNLAKFYGGGGHAGAAGFKMNRIAARQAFPEVFGGSRGSLFRFDEPRERRV